MASVINSESSAGVMNGERRPPAGGRRSRLSLRGGDGPRKVPWIWIVPGLAVAIAIQFYPVISGAYYSFTNWSGLGAAHWTGLKNFSLIFSDPDALGSLEHTLELGFSFVLIANALGLALAVGLGRALKTRNLIRALFFAPVVLTPLATSYVWAYIFQYTGPLNGFLSALGLQSIEQAWLGSPTWALWTILVVLVWGFTGLTMTLYLAGLQGIPEEIDEAAAVDGASTLFRLRRLTVPLLAPSVTISITLTTITGLRVFDQVIGLTGGGPANATETLATQLYEQGFANGRAGYGAALGVMLTALIAIVAVAQVLVLRRREARL